jgi:hypothetical protein
MPGLQFADQNQQVIVRLSDDTLTYQPADGKAWKCRLSDVAWTDSVRDSHGVREVRLHARNGGVTARLPYFDGIERCYVAVVRQLTARPVFHSVRDQLPTQIPLLERVLWLACQSIPADGAWEQLYVEENAGVVAASNGLLLACGARPLERVPWTELCGVRCRNASPFQEAPEVLFFFRDRFLALPLSCPPDAFLEYCARRARSEATFRLEGVRCKDASLAMTFAPELARARDAGYFRPDETVWSCAFGEARGQLLPAAGVAPDVPEEPNRTELYLTDRRLLRVFYPADGSAPVREGVLLDRLPRMRRSGTTLLLGALELDTDPAQPFDMAGRFVDAYRGLLRESLDPFAPEPDGVQSAVAEICATPAQQLLELERLRHLGFLSDEEYDEQAEALRHA